MGLYALKMHRMDVPASALTVAMYSLWQHPSRVVCVCMFNTLHLDITSLIFRSSSLLFSYLIEACCSLKHAAIISRRLTMNFSAKRKKPDRI